MTTSAVTNWELTKNTIIESALRKCQVLAKGQTPDAEDYADCGEALNALLQTLGTEGMPLWKRVEQSIPLVAGTSEYTVANALKIAQIVVQDTTVIELTKKSLYDLNMLPLNTSGYPIHYALLPELEDIGFRVWPTPDTGTAATKTLKVVFQKEYDSFNAAGDTPDFPAYWTEAIIYGLATRIAPEYGVPLQDRQVLMQEYMQVKNAAEGYMGEDGSLYFSPDWRR